MAKRKQEKLSNVLRRVLEKREVLMTPELKDDATENEQQAAKNPANDKDKPAPKN